MKQFNFRKRIAILRIHVYRARGMESFWNRAIFEKGRAAQATLDRIYEAREIIQNMSKKISRSTREHVSTRDDARSRCVIGIFKSRLRAAHPTYNCRRVV